MGQIYAFVGRVAPDDCLPVTKLNPEEVSFGTVAVLVAVGTEVEIFRGVWILRNCDLDLLNPNTFVLEDCGSLDSLLQQGMWRNSCAGLFHQICNRDGDLRNLDCRYQIELSRLDSQAANLGRNRKTAVL